MCTLVHSLLATLKEKQTNKQKILKNQEETIGYGICIG